LLLDALAVPAQVYVSSSLGAGDPDGAHRVGRRCLRLGLIAGIALGVVTAGLAFWVPALFTADIAIRHAATVALLVAALTQPMAAAARRRPRRLRRPGRTRSRRPGGSPRSGRPRSAGAARSARWSGRLTRWPARPGRAHRRSGRWC